MKKYSNPNQEISNNLLLAGGIIILSAVIISTLFYYINYELLFIFSFLKIGLLFMVIAVVNLRFPFYNFRYCIVIALLSTIVLIIYPHYLEFLNYSKSENSNDQVSFLSYIKYYYANTEFKVTTVGGLNRTHTDSAVFLDIFKGLLYCISQLVGFWHFSQVPYSSKLKKSFKSVFYLQYNKYQKDFVDYANENNLLDVIYNVLGDKKRFETVNAKKGDISIYLLNGDNQKIVSINNKYFVLTDTEFDNVKNMLITFGRDITKITSVC